MSNEQNESDATAHPVDMLVMVLCACGAEFGRENKYFDMYEDCKINFPNAATFYKRKNELCDACHDAKIRKALGALPKVIEAICGAL